MILHIEGVSAFGKGAGRREIPKKGESIDIEMNIK